MAKFMIAECSQIVHRNTESGLVANDSATAFKLR